MKLGIVGISGLVGENILESLKILKIKYDDLYLFGNSTVGTIIEFNGKKYTVLKFDYEYLNSLDYIILAVDNDIAKDIISYHRENNCSSVVIDNSSEYRLDNSVPLVVPEINKDLIGNNKIIANPNCSTTMLVMLLKPLLDLSEISKVVVSTYQAASGAGKVGLDELITQTSNYINDTDLQTNFWKRQYVFNVFSHNSKIIPELKYNQEEVKMIKETKKILNRNFKINPTCIRVPTLRSHCLSVNVQFENKVEETEIYKVLNNFSGVKIINDEVNNKFPEPVLTSGNTDVYVGRIRPEYDYENDSFDKTNWSFFISGDQLLKGAAFNSVQILSEIIRYNTFDYKEVSREY
jgi:aspartate-semialdehyde dehydrogenase